MRGNGTLFKQKGSRFWWCQYCVNSKRIRESTRTTSKTERGDLRGTQLGPTLPGSAGGAGSTHDPVPGASREHVALVLASPEFQWA